MPQLARWLTFIEEFDYEVVPRGGRRHTNGDGLRRRTGPLAVSYTGAIESDSERTSIASNWIWYSTMPLPSKTML